MRSKRRQRKVTKKASLRSHVRRRALERYGLRFTTDDLHNIERVIREGKGRFLGRQSRRVTGWEVMYAECLLTVLYDKSRRCAITILPESAVWKHEEVLEAKPGKESGQPPTGAMQGSMAIGPGGLDGTMPVVDTGVGGTKCNIAHNV